MSSGNLRPICLGLSVLTYEQRTFLRDLGYVHIKSMRNGSQYPDKEVMILMKFEDIQFVFLQQARISFHPWPAIKYKCASKYRLIHRPLAQPERQAFACQRRLKNGGNSHQSRAPTISQKPSWWVQWCLKSPASRLFALPFVEPQIKENINAPRHWPLWGESTAADRWIPLTKVCYLT